MTTKTEGHAYDNLYTEKCRVCGGKPHDKVHTLTVRNEAPTPSEERCWCGKPLDHEIHDVLRNGFDTHYATPTQPKKKTL